jgi:SAM-dependent methyltransferase
MVYSSPRLAQAYACDRPALHAVQLSGFLKPGFRRALDVGCGAGLSARALLPYARHVVGLEPSLTMLRYRLPGVSYVAASSEHIPFRDNSFDLITAAGSLNYASRDLSLRSIMRVLAPGGTFVLYDFWCAAFPSWWSDFGSRYPASPGYDMERLSFMEYADIQLLGYAMSETNVEEALMRGVPLESIREWCLSSLTPLFTTGTVEIDFRGHVAMYQSPAQV